MPLSTLRDTETGQQTSGNLCSLVKIVCPLTCCRVGGSCWWSLAEMCRDKVYGAALVTSVSHGHPLFEWKNPDTIHSVRMSGFSSFFFKSFSFLMFKNVLLSFCAFDPLSFVYACLREINILFFS